MDLNELRKRFSPSKPQISDSIDDHSRAQATRPIISFNFIAANLTKTFAALLIILPVLITFSFFYRNPTSDHRFSLFADARVLDPKSSALNSHSSGN